MSSTQPPAHVAFAFPGRWLAGTSLLFGPVLPLFGVLLRARFHFFFPDQLAAYDRHPMLMTASYSCFAAGTVALWPALGPVCCLGLALMALLPLGVLKGTTPLSIAGAAGLCAR